MPNLKERVWLKSTQPTELSPSSWRWSQDSDWESMKVKSDSMKCSRLLTSRSLLPPFPLYRSLPPLPLALCLFLESPVGNVNRDFTAQCRRISRAHISPTCDLHQRRGSWGIFHASEGRRSSDGHAGGGWARGVGLASTLGLDAVRDSNNGGTDHQTERRFYGNLHDCIRSLLLKCHHKMIHRSDWFIQSVFQSRSKCLGACLPACLHIWITCIMCTTICAEAATCDVFKLLSLACIWPQKHTKRSVLILRFVKNFQMTLMIKNNVNKIIMISPPEKNFKFTKRKKKYWHCMFYRKQIH